MGTAMNCRISATTMRPTNTPEEEGPWRIYLVKEGDDEDMVVVVVVMMTMMMMMD